MPPVVKGTIKAGGTPSPAPFIPSPPKGGGVGSSPSPSPTTTPTKTVTSSPHSMLSDLSRTFSSKKNTVPEDVFDTYKVFEEILGKMEEIDIIGKKDVPQDYTTLIQINNETPDKSFETNGLSTPILTTGGKKYKRSKTKKGRKTRKHRKKKSRRNKKQ